MNEIEIRLLYHTLWRWYYIKVGFIGPGKVGVNLGRYFTHKGIKLTGFYGETEKSAREAANITKSKFYNNIEEIIKESDILFITTPDDVISIIDKKLSMFDLKNKSVCHTSGSIQSTVLYNAKHSGALIYSIHPICAFSNKNMNLKELETIYFSIEGDISLVTDDFINSSLEINNTDKTGLPVINLMNKLQNKYFIRNRESSSTYHLANVFVSNLSLSLIEIGVSYLKKLGLSESESLKALRPLVYGNINSIFEKGFVNSLTGPVVRGDVNTVKKHLDSVKHDDIELYKNLSLNLLKLVALKTKSNFSNENSNEITKTNGINKVDDLTDNDKENALNNLLNTSKKHLEIYNLLGGME